MATLLATSTLKKLIRLKEVTIDDLVFRLHYQATAVTLMAFSILVTGTQFFGEPIRCIQKDDIPERLLNTYCWVESTYSLPKAYLKKIGSQVPYPGVDKTEDGDEVVSHSYYQWVCFVLFLQAMLFYTPRYLWRSCEGGRISKILLNLNNPVLKEDVRDEKCNSLIVYFRSSMTRNTSYALQFLLCEFLNFINVTGQIYLIDSFLGGEFTTYGTEVIRFSETDQVDRLDPMVRIFPRMTKCRFHRYGSSGDVQRHDAFCLLPLNIVNEKIYIIIWFWFVILATLTGITLFWHLLLMFSRDLRTMVFRYYNNLADSREVTAIMSKASYGDWFLLHLLNRNIHNLHFKHFLSKLAEVMDPKSIGLNDKTVEASDSSTSFV